MRAFLLLIAIAGCKSSSQPTPAPGNATRIAPENIEMVYWSAVSLAGAGCIDETIPMFKRAVSADRAWQELTRRLVPAGLLTQPTADRLLKDAR